MYTGVRTRPEGVSGPLATGGSAGLGAFRGKSR